jgi:hypothetical protein
VGKYGFVVTHYASDFDVEYPCWLLGEPGYNILPTWLHTLVKVRPRSGRAFKEWLEKERRKEEFERTFEGTYEEYLEKRQEFYD